MAVKKIEFHDEAAAEYEASFDWYLEQSPDAARRFDVEVEHAISQIRKVPLGWGDGPPQYTQVFAAQISISLDLSRTPLR